jgi:hypothetical protein
VEGFTQAFKRAARKYLGSGDVEEMKLNDQLVLNDPNGTTVTVAADAGGLYIVDDESGNDATVDTTA